MGGGARDTGPVYYTSTLPKEMIHFVSGGIAGSTAKTMSAPLDRVKILFQTRNPHYYGHSIVGMLRKIVRTEGFMKLWRGNTATLIRVFPYAAVQFTAYERYKKKLVPKDGKANTLLHLICGSMAGATAVAFTYPLDLVRARMASQVTHETYKSVPDALYKIYTNEGWKALFRGMQPTVQGIIPYAGVNFGVYETLKYYAPRGEETGRISTTMNLICGGLAGATGQTISYPWDVVRRRLQTWGFAEGTKSVKPGGTLKTMLRIIKYEGFMSLFKGISINYIKVSPTVAVSFTTYELVQVHVFGKYN